MLFDIKCRSVDSLFESAADTGRLSTTIEKILTDFSTFELIAKDSFLHVNGVYKIVLAKATYQDPEVRLHIWENGINLPEGSNYEHIHNHRWSFHSKVIAGVFYQHLFHIVDKHEGPYDHYRFVAVAPGKLNTVLHFGQSEVEQSFAVNLHVGQSYYLHQSVLHKFEPVDNNFSATLIVRAPYSADHSSVYVRSGEPLHTATREGLITIGTQKTRELLSELNRRLFIYSGT